ncbi:MAG: hypothetical protein GY866_38750 [Proteobacteria bacterium]|nr:hypothetical protein [Pseudomonadota bacterium]
MSLADGLIDPGLTGGFFHSLVDMGMCFQRFEDIAALGVPSADVVELRRHLRCKDRLKAGLRTIAAINALKQKKKKNFHTPIDHDRQHQNNYRIGIKPSTIKSGLECLNQKKSDSWVAIRWNSDKTVF